MNIKEIRKYLEVQIKPLHVVYDRGLNETYLTLTIVTEEQLGETMIEEITEKVMAEPGQSVQRQIIFAFVYRRQGGPKFDKMVRSS